MSLSTPTQTESSSSVNIPLLAKILINLPTDAWATILSFITEQPPSLLASLRPLSRGSDLIVSSHFQSTPTLSLHDFEWSLERWTGFIEYLHRTRGERSSSLRTLTLDRVNIPSPLLADLLRSPISRHIETLRIHACRRVLSFHSDALRSLREVVVERAARSAPLAPRQLARSRNSLRLLALDSVIEFDMRSVLSMTAADVEALLNEDAEVGDVAEVAGQPTSEAERQLMLLRRPLIAVSTSASSAVPPVAPTPIISIEPAVEAVNVASPLAARATLISASVMPSFAFTQLRYLALVNCERLGLLDDIFFSCPRLCLVALGGSVFTTPNAETVAAWARACPDLEMIDVTFHAGFDELRAYALPRPRISSLVCGSGAERSPINILSSGMRTSREAREVARVATAAQEANARTPLHHAVIRGRADLVSALLELGAECDRKDSKGWTPLALALDLGAPHNNRSVGIGGADCVRALLAGGADLFARNANLESPLFIAALKGRVDCMELMIEHLKRLDHEQRMQQQQRMVERAYSLSSSSTSTVSCKSVSPSQLSTWEAARSDASLFWGGWTPVQGAMMAQSRPMLQLLLAHGFDAWTPNRYALTPLHLAAQRGFVEGVQMLLAHSVHGAEGSDEGANECGGSSSSSSGSHVSGPGRIDVNARDAYGRTALDLAISGGAGTKILPVSTAAPSATSSFSSAAGTASASEHSTEAAESSPVPAPLPRSDRARVVDLLREAGGRSGKDHAPKQNKPKAKAALKTSGE
jgi:ankyrin repeat protein